MKLVTECLEIVLLTPVQLAIWCDNLTQLENSFGCVYEGQPMDGFLGDIVKKQVAICRAHIDNLCWLSFWLIIDKNTNTIVGSCGFKNIPNENKEVEIGYGLGKCHEHKGYMTRCIAAISEWALIQSNVKNVIAETEPYNIPSENVLVRCGYEHYKTTGENKWWRL